jgi:hypothetical protein
MILSPFWLVALMKATYLPFGESSTLDMKLGAAQYSSGNGSAAMDGVAKAAVPTTPIAATQDKSKFRKATSKYKLIGICPKKSPLAMQRASKSQ